MRLCRRAVHRVQQLEAGLRQTQRLAVLGSLATGVAHDLNNLLTVILANAEFLATSGPGVEGRDAAGEVHAAGLRAGALTRQLLRFSVARGSSRGASTRWSGE